MPEPSVIVENLTVPGRLEGVSFTVRRGSVHALLGSNGSGKSTVLQCVLGLEHFTGSVRVTPGRVAVVPQRFGGDGAMSLTVCDFLALQRAQRPVALGLSRALRSRLEALLAGHQAAALATKLMHELSGGELRRLLLINAIDPRPDLLLLDEPEAGLDDVSVEWLESVVSSLKTQGVTVLLISHEAALVQRVADEVTRLAGGRRV